MDDLIKRKSTGCAEQFASKLGVSESQLFQDLKEMKELGAPIEYCHSRRSYIYENGAGLKLYFSKNMQNIKGGQNIFNNYRQSSMAGVEQFNLASQNFES